MNRIKRRRWNEHERQVCVEDIHGQEDHVRSHFTLPEITYIGSSLGCGCGFRSLTFQQGTWLEEWMIVNGKGEPPENHIQDHQELYDVIASAARQDEVVELYGCWDGDEAHPAEHEEEITRSRLLDAGFWFRERGLYRMIPADPDGEPA